MPARARTRTATYHHGDLRAALLRAVDGVLRERGPAGVSLREVARRARVSHAAPAHHFRNKAALLSAFVAEAFSELERVVALEVRRVRAEDGPTLLAALGRGYVRFGLRHPERFALMFRNDFLDPEDPDLVARRDRVFSLLTEAVRRCVREGRIAAAEAEVLAAASWSLVHGLSSLWLTGRLGERLAPRTDPERLTAAVIELFVAGVLGPPSRGSRRRRRP